MQGLSSNHPFSGATSVISDDSTVQKNAFDAFEDDSKSDLEGLSVGLRKLQQL